jgi:hypothetical protein
LKHARAEVHDFTLERGEAPGDHGVLFGRNAWLAADDEVSLAYRPVVPTIEGDLKAVSERTRR